MSTIYVISDLGLEEELKEIRPQLQAIYEEIEKNIKTNWNLENGIEEGSPYYLNYYEQVNVRIFKNQIYTKFENKEDYDTQINKMNNTEKKIRNIFEKFTKKIDPTDSEYSRQYYGLFEKI